LSDEKIDQLTQERAEARKRKDFAAADRIRAALAKGGIVLEDKAGGTIWRRVG
jgi:cysteinyl-tRNA synthetase